MLLLSLYHRYCRRQPNKNVNELLGRGRCVVVPTILQVLHLFEVLSLCSVMLVGMCVDLKQRTDMARIKH